MPNTPLPIRARSSHDQAQAPPTSPEREAVAALLSERFADDSLSLDEFEKRVAIVYSTASRRELNALTADLAAPAAIPSTGGPVAMAAPADTVPAHGRRFAILSNLEHHSIAVVPRRLEVSAIFGNVELDLSDATFGGGTTGIDVRAVFGHVGIVVPPGAIVEHHGSGILGSFECPSSPRSAGLRAGPVISITGHAVFGAVEIRFAEADSRAARDAGRVDRPRGRS